MKKLFLISAIGLFLISGQYIAGAASAGFDDGAGPADQGSVSKRGKIEDYELHQSIIEGKSIDTISALINDLSFDDCNTFNESGSEFDYFTPAMLAVYFDRLDVLKELYKKGVNLNLIVINHKLKEKEFTVLSLALEKFRFDMAHWLFDLKNEKNDFIINRYKSLFPENDFPEDDYYKPDALMAVYHIIDYLNENADFLGTTVGTGARVVYLCNPQEGVGQQALQDDSVDKAYSLLLRYFQEDLNAYEKSFSNGKTPLKFAEENEYDKKIIDILKIFHKEPPLELNPKWYPSK